MAVELKQKSIALIKPKAYQTVQVTLDEDFNVPDIKPDIDFILQNSSFVNILNTQVTDGKVIFKGEFKTSVLYVPLNNEKPVHSMSGLIPFDDTMNMDTVTKNDTIKTQCVIEDVKVKLINSRKINVKILLDVKLTVDAYEEIYIPLDVEGLESIQKKMNDITICQPYVSKKETYKIKDELAIPSSKSNIMEILWYDCAIKNKEIRLLDDKINIKGSIALATLYAGESGENNLEFVEHEFNFNGILDCDGCRDDMYSDIHMRISDAKLQIKPDLDGEERVLAIDVVNELDINVYHEEKINIVTDLYSLKNEMVVKKEKTPYQRMLCKNQSQCKIKDTITINDNEPNIFQIYYANGYVNIDNIDKLEDKIEVEGVVFCKVMYVAGNDQTPINVYETMLPFSQVIDAEGIHDQCLTYIYPSLNYINCSMIGDKEVEIKCSVTLDTLVFEEKNMDIIFEVSEEDIDYKKLQSMPSIVGYIVKDKENLWDIAKRYYTRVEDIMATNELETEEVQKGHKLIILKNVASLEL